MKRQPPQSTHTTVRCKGRKLIFICAVRALSTPSIENIKMSCIAMNCDQCALDGHPLCQHHHDDVNAYINAHINDFPRNKEFILDVILKNLPTTGTEGYYVWNTPNDRPKAVVKARNIYEAIYKIYQTDNSILNLNYDNLAQIMYFAIIYYRSNEDPLTFCNYEGSEWPLTYDPKQIVNSHELYKYVVELYLNIYVYNDSERSWLIDVSEQEGLANIAKLSKSQLL